MMTNLVPNNEMVLDKYSDAVGVSEYLIANGYAVMITKEMGRFIVNFIYAAYDSGCEEPDRNVVVFMPRDEYESILFDNSEDEE